MTNFYSSLVQNLKYILSLWSKINLPIYTYMYITHCLNNFDICLDDITINNILLFYHTKKINSMFRWVYRNRSHKMSKCDRNVNHTLTWQLFMAATFLFLPHFDLI